HPQLIARLREAEEEADLAYFDEHGPPSFERCFEGLSRIGTIVGAMKEFAHPDARDKAPADLNQALTTTLAISKNEYKYVADIQTELGELPPVYCYVGDLNQVFLNLIVNAAHAIADVVADTGNRGTITVRTFVTDPDTVCIQVADTGCGIPKSAGNRIYDPFFTTKPVGKGSGQGLAIARSIVVDKHDGTLSFESEEGKGTVFSLRLPIDGASKSPRSIR
ncbi:MAG: sensor histidine kinase, partial [Myxococcota bacterium]